MSANNSGTAVWGTELTNGTFATGTYVAMSGVFTEPPVIVIIQNDTNNTVLYTHNPTVNNPAISFVAGARLVLDLRANHGIAATLCFSKGVQPYAQAPTGTTGAFHIAYIFAEPT